VTVQLALDGEGELGEVAVAAVIFPSCRSASSMSAAVQRRHMRATASASTLREVRRTISIIDSQGFVDGNVRPQNPRLTQVNI
jgi:hypothetical protein